MKIKIKSKGIRFTLYLPLSLIKCKFIYKPLAENYIEKVNLKTQEKATADYNLLAKQFYTALKIFKAKSGKFTLVDVIAADGTIVKIII